VRPFLGTFENKVDRKGRVSVPATFRQNLAQTSFQGVVVFASHKAEAIEACSMDFMAELSENVDSYDLFSEAQEDLAATLFADSHQLAFDGEGRIMLPDDLCAHAGITDKAAFMGMGKTFRIWEPARLAEFKLSARDRAKQKGLTLSRRPQGGEG
jgi:MraZ protein